MAACVATAATYVFFLIFAQFALLALAARAGVAAETLQSLMAAMGAGGLAGAAGAARLYSPARGRAMLVAGFVACALGAQLATLAGTTGQWAAVFAFVGLALGALTVTLAALLRGAAGGARLGLCTGLGTGAAYALCNLPSLFTASPVAQAWIAVAAAAVGAMTAGRFPGEGNAAPEAPVRGTVVRWIAVLAALVWMDSAVFRVIQQTPALRAQTWEGNATLLANALVHLAAGVASGRLLDAGWRRLPVVLAVALLAAASLMLAGALPGFAPGWLYAAGVSFYSAALVYFPASTGRAGVAALVYGVAGWVGSALGIGLAQDLNGVPVWFVAVAVAAVAVASGWRGRGAMLFAAAFLTLVPLGWAEGRSVRREAPPPAARLAGAGLAADCGGADPGLELARLIKSGLPGSPWAGHGCPRGAEILGLARAARGWHKDSAQSSR
ncbi:MAG: hypothetical protein C0502_03465 [Opitutus sp.]|nr:hypothetical protein [Opitutus sp.]